MRKLITTNRRKLLFDKLIEGTLTNEEGKLLLAGLSQDAAAKWKRGSEMITLAVIDLHLIREHGLHMYAEVAFEEFLESWLDENRFGRSTTFDYLRVARLWVGGCDRPIEELLEYAGGIQTIRPVFIGENAMVDQYDRATGHILSLKNGWEELAPSGENPGEQVSSYIDKIHPDDTASTVHQALREDNPQKDYYVFGITHTEVGKPAEVSWSFVLVTGENAEGYGVVTMPAHVFDTFCTRLRIKKAFR